MNEWERERRRTNTLQSPGEGNARAASSLGSIPSSKGCAFHIPAGLPTPGRRMLWTGVSTYSLSAHDQKFLFAKKEVGANPPSSSGQFPSQCIGIFPPPKAFHKSFPAHSLLWPLKAVSVTGAVSVAGPIGVGSTLLIPMAANLYGWVFSCPQIHVMVWKTFMCLI